MDYNWSLCVGSARRSMTLKEIFYGRFRSLLRCITNLAAANDEYPFLYRGCKFGSGLWSSNANTFLMETNTADNKNDLMSVIPALCQ